MMSSYHTSILFESCTSFSKIGWILLMTAAVSLIFSSFPFYILINFSWKEYEPAVTGFSKAIKVYLLAFIATEMFGNMFVVPVFFIQDMQNLVCWPVNHSEISTDAICALSFCSYFTYKLLSMFFTTFTGYSCILHFNQSAKLIRGENRRNENKSSVYEAQVSLITESEQSSHQSGSPCEVQSKTPLRRRPIWFMLLFIIMMSLLIASLPLFRLGPFKLKTPNISRTLVKTNMTLMDKDEHGHAICTLFSFATPTTEKEYIFPFTLLMASSSCLLILVKTFVAVLSGRIKSKEKLFEEVALFVSVQGLLFFATWLPVLISICFAISEKDVPKNVQWYLILVTFLNCLTHPFLLGYCLSFVRNGYRSIFRSLKIIKVVEEEGEEGIQ